MRLLLIKEFPESRYVPMVPRQTLECPMDIPFVPTPGLNLTLGPVWRETIQELAYDLAGGFFWAYLADAPVPSPDYTPGERRKDLNSYLQSGWLPYHIESRRYN
jgi:hypothetical protein